MERTAWIAGATGALGSATARVFHESGWKLGLMGRSAERLERVGRGIAGTGAAVPFAMFDAAAAADTAALQGLERDTGAPDACLYVAGGFEGGREPHECGPEDWDRIVAMNLTGAALVLGHAYGSMVRSGRGGVLLAVGSTAAERPVPGALPYGVAKAGLHHLVRSLAEEGRGRRIRANLYIPAALDTEANRQAMPRADRTGWTPVEDAARILLWMCSADAARLSGSVLQS